MTEIPNELPFVSILAPCRNEAKYVQSAIESILTNDYPSDRMEVLVLDGMSTDATRQIVQAMVEHDHRIKLIENPGKIVPTAMNIGIAAASGDYIIRIDCHTKFANDYIRKCLEVHCRSEADNVGGYCTTLPGANTQIAKAIAAATSCKFGIGNSQFRLSGEEKEVDTAPFGTFKKELFTVVGGYDERLVRNQDIELNSRIRKAGGKIVISPEIKLSYYNRATLKGLWQQAFNNGLWNPYTIWLVGGGLSLRHFVPMFFVLTLTSFAVASLLWSPFLICLAAIILSYSVVAFVFALRAKTDKNVSIPLVWLCFWVLHVAYGLGSLWGVVTIPFKFPNRNVKMAGQALADRKE